MINFIFNNFIKIIILVSSLILMSCQLVDNRVKGSIGPDKLCFPEYNNNEPYAKGSGTAADPYVLCTAKQLNNIGQRPQDWDKHFAQGKDIDLSYYDGSTSEKTFNIIGIDTTDFFSGSYDGKNHSINNFTLNLPTNNLAGFFSAIEGASIKDMKFNNANLSHGGEATGILVGAVGGESTIANIHISGSTISKSGDYTIGGMIGNTYGDSVIIKDSSYTGQVTGDDFVGGLIGLLASTNTNVENCSTDSIVTATNSMAGGLVGYIIAGDGSISNSFTVGTTTAGDAVGGLIGYSNNYTVSNSYATGNVISSTSNGTGGLIGKAVSTTINSSYATGNVNAVSNQVGGLVGRAEAVSISDSYALGDVIGNNNIGGLIGNDFGTSTIQRSYAKGEVTSLASNIGGLIGASKEATITETFALGNVSGSTRVGGLIGYAGLSTLITIERSFAKGNVTGTADRIGGFIGDNQHTLSVINDCFATGNVTTPGDFVGGFVGYSMGTFNRSYSTGTVNGGGPYVGGFGGGMYFKKSNSIYSDSSINTGGGLIGNSSVSYAPIGSYFTSNDAAHDNGYGTQLSDNPVAARTYAMQTWDITTVWEWKAKNINPTLRWYQPDYCSEANKAKAPYAGGGGTSNDPYIICTAQQLNTIGATQSDWDKHFLQKADIDLNDYDGSMAEKTFKPMGSFDGVTLTPFTGVYDGDGFKIKNFTYPDSINNNFAAGLFPLIDGATLSNISLENVAINASGHGYVGALVGGAQNSIIESSKVHSGVVSGDFNVGGLVGYTVAATGNISEVNDSYSAAQVVATGTAVGGLVGSFSKNSFIRRSFSSGDVSGFNGVGGLVGVSFELSEFPLIAGSYATGNVSGNEGVGGLIGTFLAETLYDSFSTGNVTGVLKVGGLIGYVGSNYGDVIDCYSLGDVSGTTDVGGFIGYAPTLTPPTMTGYFTDVAEDNGRGTPATGPDFEASARDGGSNLGANWDFDYTWKGPASNAGNYINTTNPKFIWEDDE